MKTTIKSIIAAALCAVGLAVGAKQQNVALAALETAFDAERTGTTVESVATNGVFAWNLVILGTNYIGGVTLPNDLGKVTIDLNGWAIRGVNGANGTVATSGGNGTPAIVIGDACGAAAGVTALTVIGFPVDDEGFDTTAERTEPYCSTTFIPGDYCIVDLGTGEITQVRGVTDGTIFNTDEYKTVKMVFRYVPDGKFHANCATWNNLSKGQTKNDMSLSAYWMAVFPVTEAQYDRVMKVASPSSSMKPKVFISWSGFRGGDWTGTSGKPEEGKFVDKLNKLVSGQPGAAAYPKAIGPQPFDLCKEFQWERAARGGTRTDYFFMETSVLDVAADKPSYTGTIYQYAWCDGNKTSLQPTGLLKPSTWGFYDIYGSVYAVCLDHPAELTGTEGQTKDYGGVSTGDVRVSRGGNWPYNCCDSSSPFRFTGIGENYTARDVGFHLVRNDVGNRPAAGTHAALAGGNGGAGSPFGTGAPAVLDVNGNEMPVVDPLGYVKKGADGQVPVPYLDWDDEKKEMTGAVCTVYTEYTGQTTLDAGTTYVVTGDVMVASAITVNGTEASPTRLILCDGKKLTAQKGVDVASGNALIICAQEGGTGALEATGDSYGAGIGSVSGVKGGVVTINGGTVTATGGTQGAGIGGGSAANGGTVTINGGTVTATGRNGAAGIGGGKDATDQGTLTFGAGFVGGVLAGVDEASAVYMTTTAYTNDHSAKYVTMPRFVLKIPAGTHYTYVVSNGTEGITGELVNGTNEYIVAKGATLKVYFTPDENYEWEGDFTNPKEIGPIESDTVIYASEMPKAVTVFVAEVTVGGEGIKYKDFNEAWKKAHEGTSESPATLKLLRNIHLTNTMETVTQQPE